METSGIYKIQSLIKPERCYIGSAVNISYRWKKHLEVLNRNQHHSKKLQNHYNKYGKNDLIFSIVIGCEKNDLIITEQYFIDLIDPFFNICKIAGSTLGTHRKLSEETRKRMSFARMGKKNPNYGKHASDANKKRTSEVNKGNKYSIGIKRPDNVIRNIENKFGCLNKGVPKTEEHKQKISKSNMGQVAWNKGKPMDQKHKDMLIAINKGNKYCVGRIFSEETKRKISESQLKRLRNIA